MALTRASDFQGHAPSAKYVCHPKYNSALKMGRSTRSFGISICLLDFMPSFRGSDVRTQAKGHAEQQAEPPWISIPSYIPVMSEPC